MSYGSTSGAIGPSVDVETIIHTRQERSPLKDSSMPHVVILNGSPRKGLTHSPLTEISHRLSERGIRVTMIGLADHEIGDSQGCEARIRRTSLCWLPAHANAGNRGVPCGVTERGPAHQDDSPYRPEMFLPGSTVSRVRSWTKSQALWSVAGYHAPSGGCVACRSSCLEDDSEGHTLCNSGIEATGYALGTMLLGGGSGWGHEDDQEGINAIDAALDLASRLWTLPQATTTVVAKNT